MLFNPLKQKKHLILPTFAIDFVYGHRSAHTAHTTFEASQTAAASDSAAQNFFSAVSQAFVPHFSIIKSIKLFINSSTQKFFLKKLLATPRSASW